MVKCYYFGADKVRYLMFFFKNKGQYLSVKVLAYWGFERKIEIDYSSSLLDSRYSLWSFSCTSDGTSS